MAENLHKEVERGAKADRVLAECDEYFVMVRQGILNTWAESPVGDAEGQHKLRMMLKLLEDVRANVRDAALTGQLARVQIKEEEQRKTATQRFLNKFGVRV